MMDDILAAPNTYSLPSLIGKTVEGNKKSGPAFTQTGRSKVGGFSEDLQRVCVTYMYMQYGQLART